MPNTGMFRLLVVVPNTTSDRMRIDLVRAECMSCRSMICLFEPPHLVNIPAGGVSLTCTQCGGRQGISAARFIEFMAKFPCGQSEAEHGHQVHA